SSSKGLLKHSVGLMAIYVRDNHAQGVAYYSDYSHIPIYTPAFISIASIQKLKDYRGKTTSPPPPNHELWLPSYMLFGCLVHSPAFPVVVTSCTEHQNHSALGCLGEMPRQTGWA